jgi:hypothetical protein
MRCDQDALQLKFAIVRLSQIANCFGLAPLAKQKVTQGNCPQSLRQ